MIVCLCKVVTDRAIDQLIDDGAASAAEIAQACGAGAGCGACVPAIEGMIAAMLAGGPSACRDCPRLTATVRSPYVAHLEHGMGEAG